MAHLIIICDEFAELKQQQPEFMDELMSVSRIGRSLGVHLILATQKPVGIVNDQIRSNSKFTICLKVQDKSDSLDVINRPDAALLKRAGQFYMQVGYNEYFVLGQSGWAGAPYIPSDLTKKEEDNSVEFVSNTGTTFYQLEEEKSKVIEKKGEQLTNPVNYLSNLAKRENISENTLWKPSIPKDVYLDNLKAKYSVNKVRNIIEPVIGEFDDPSNQRQGVIKLNLSNNVCIYGNAESGKESLLSTLLYDLITTYTPEEAEVYILDFGSEALKIYNAAPHIGDVVFSSDTEKLSRFFDMIQAEVSKRKNILSNYNGDYTMYLKEANEPMPMKLVVINNFEAFMELYEIKYEDILLSLTREGIKCGISFIVTTSAYNGMRYRLSQNFKQKIVLQLNHKDDYLSIFDNIGRKTLPSIFGRGFIQIERNVYEFQTAKICEPEEYNSVLKAKIDELNEIYKVGAEKIATLPEVVEYSDIKDCIDDLTNVPIGIITKDLRVYQYNFKSRFVHLMTGKNINEIARFLSYVLATTLNIKNTDVKIFDAEKVLNSRKLDLSEEFNSYKLKIKFNKSTNFICAIIGIERFTAEYESSENSFLNSLKELEESGNCTLVIADCDTKMKNQEYSEWFRQYASKDNAIWVGNGVDGQYLINISDRKELVNKCGATLGYVIKQGNAHKIKLLKMKEDDEV